jgi:hypothetical protein
LVWAVAGEDCLSPRAGSTAEKHNLNPDLNRNPGFPAIRITDEPAKNYLIHRRDLDFHLQNFLRTSVKNAPARFSTLFFKAAGHSANPCLMLVPAIRLVIQGSISSPFFGRPPSCELFHKRLPGAGASRNFCA